MTKADNALQIPSSPYYLVDRNGNLRFTPNGIAELQDYFAMAGIHIKEIRTYQGYLNARRAASPYFLEWLESRSRLWPKTKQFNLLRETLLNPDKT